MNLSFLLGPWTIHLRKLGQKNLTKWHPIHLCLSHLPNFIPAPLSTLSSSSITYEWSQPSSVTSWSTLVIHNVLISILHLKCRLHLYYQMGVFLVCSSLFSSLSFQRLRFTWRSNYKSPHLCPSGGPPWVWWEWMFLMGNMRTPSNLSAIPSKPPNMWPFYPRTSMKFSHHGGTYDQNP